MEQYCRKQKAFTALSNNSAPSKRVQFFTKTDERWKIARNVGFIKKNFRKKEKRRYVGRMLQRAGEEIPARVSPRGAACTALCPRKNGQKKIVQKSSAELKTTRKRRKSWTLMIFSFAKSLNEERERERNREIPLGIIVQQDYSSLCTLVTSSD